MQRIGKNKSQAKDFISVWILLSLHGPIESLQTHNAACNTVCRLCRDTSTPNKGHTEDRPAVSLRFWRLRHTHSLLFMNCPSYIHWRSARVVEPEF